MKTRVEIEENVQTAQARALEWVLEENQSNEDGN